jgi:hypothetical protein
MTETMQSTPAELVDRSRELSAAHGLADGALGAVLLSLVERLEAPFAIKDIATGKYVHVNLRMAALYGRSPEQLLGHTDTDLLGPELSAPLRSADQSALAQSHAHTIDHRIERDKQRREFSVTRVPLATADGGPPRHLCIVWVETTLLQQREAQLSKALQQLEQQQVATEALRRETQDQALRDNVTGLYQRVHFDDQLRREVDLSSAGCCAAIPARWTPRAVSTKTTSRSCCRVSGWPPLIRAWKGCAGNARRRSSCSTDATSASRSRWASRAFRTPRTRKRN